MLRLTYVPHVFCDDDIKSLSYRDPKCYYFNCLSNSFRMIDEQMARGEYRKHSSQQVTARVVYIS